MATKLTTDKHERIKSAAVKCIRRYGAKRTSMEDIAEAAELSRRTVYHTFNSRRDLMLELIYDRVERVTAKVEKAISECSTFAEAITESSIMTIELVTSDKVYQSLYEDDGSIAILSHNDAWDKRFDEVTFSIFANAIAMGRAEGAIREELTDHELADWIRSFHYLLVAHKLTFPSEIRGMMQKFFLPSVR